MNQGSYYVYEYEQTVLRRNVGFLQVTPQYHSCTLTLHARNLPVSFGEELEVHAFFLENATLVGSPVALLSCHGQNLSTRLTISEERFPQKKDFSHIDGFLFHSNTPGKSLVWIASSVPLPEDFSLVDLSSSEIVESPTDASVHAASTETVPDTAEPEAESITEETTDPITEAEQCDRKEDTPTLQTRKLSYEELSTLPRPFWTLANNSFLLHGYHNYNHLLLVEEDGHLWLGVPGIYDPREASVADLFGFPQFTSSYVSTLDLTDEEQDSSDHFGHWCRCLR